MKGNAVPATPSARVTTTNPGVHSIAAGRSTTAARSANAAPDQEVPSRSNHQIHVSQPASQERPCCDPNRGEDRNEGASSAAAGPGDQSEPDEPGDRGRPPGGSPPPKEGGGGEEEGGRVGVYPGGAAVPGPRRFAPLTTPPKARGPGASWEGPPPPPPAPAPALGGAPT